MSDRVNSASKAGVGSVGVGSEGVNQLKVSWYYNWQPTASPRVLDAEFVPMIWNLQFLDAAIFADLKRTNRSAHLLGFNEPERADQANVTVAKALAAWPLLQQTHFRLGSPAVSLDKRGKSWLRRFVNGVEKHNLHFDFVCAHWYGDLTQPDAVDRLCDALTELHRNYQRPIWLTEFGAMDQWFGPADDRQEIIQDFLKRAVARLLSLPHVERFAWFASEPLEDYLNSALFDPASRQLTSLGEAYRECAANFSHSDRKN